MPRIAAHTVDDAPRAAAPILRSLSPGGTPLNIHAAMAASPAVLAAYAGIQAAIAEHGTFDARTREAIALAVAAVDECGYCQSVHTRSGRAAGWSDAEMVAMRRGDTFDAPRMEALLAVARAAAGNVGEVPEQLWTGAQQAGWDDTQLAETFVHVALNLYTNYFNHYAGTELDVPEAPPLNGRA